MPDQKFSRKRSIHRIVLLRLFFIWAILSVIIGGAVFYIETERIDEFVMSLAIKESKAFSGDMTAYINSPDPVHIKLLRDSVLKNMENGNFLILELYNREKQEVMKVMKTGGADIEQTLTHLDDESIHMKNSPSYIKYFINGIIYLRAYTPINYPDGKVAGYFEGIYGVDNETMKTIRDSLLMSLLLVIAVISLTTVVLYPVIIFLNRGLIKYSYQLSEANIGMLKMLGAAVSMRDSDTASHSYRVTIYAIRLAEALGLAKQDMQGVIKGGFLHDVGKIAISDTILLKPGSLTPEEFAVMQTHVEHGVELIKPYTWLQDAVDVVRYHHERFDGSGYSAKLKGDEIPLVARIFSIADYFDALTSMRPYREELSFETAMGCLSSQIGLHFDPDIFEAFNKIIRQVYDEIAHASEQDLEKILDQLISKYLDT